MPKNCYCLIVLVSIHEKSVWMKMHIWTFQPDVLMHVNSSHTHTHTHIYIWSSHVTLSTEWWPSGRNPSHQTDCRYNLSTTWGPKHCGQDSKLCCQVGEPACVTLRSYSCFQLFFGCALQSWSVVSCMHLSPSHLVTAPTSFLEMSPIVIRWQVWLQWISVIWLIWRGSCGQKTFHAGMKKDCSFGISMTILEVVFKLFCSVVYAPLPPGKKTTLIYP